MNLRFYQALASRVFSTASSVVTGALSLWLCTRYFTPAAYGAILVAVQIMSYLVLLDGGFRTTVNRGLLAEGDPSSRKKLIDFSQTFYSYLGVIILGIALIVMAGFCLTPNARESQGPVFFLAMGVAGALGLVASIQTQLLVGLGAQTECFFLNGATSWLTVGGLASALHFGFGVWAFPIATAVSFFGVFPLAVLLIRRHVPGFRVFNFRLGQEFWSHFHRLKSDAWACFRSQVSIMFLFTLDVVIIGLLCSSEEAAIYGVLSRMFAIIRNFLQTLGEVGWPMIAQKSHESGRLMWFVPRINGWIYGSVMGAVCITLGPFLSWFMGEKWAPPAALVYLLAARFLITGASSPAGYFLIGLGEFKAISRIIERELIAAAVLGWILGMRFKMEGVAVGFLAATLVGTLFPIFLVYARAAKVPLRQVVLQPWCRVVTAGIMSWLVAYNLSLTLAPGVTVLVIAVLAVVAPLAVLLGIFVFGKRSGRDLLDLV